MVDHVIVGAGQAGRRAAEELRKVDPESRILLIGDEPVPPYDRPSLSKSALQSDDGELAAFVRPIGFYAEQGIDVLLQTRVVGIHREAHTVELESGYCIGYGALLLATGSRPRVLDCPVAAEARVHYLRTMADASALRTELREARRIVVLGGGFIGLEVAASARARGCEVTVVEPNERLLMRTMPAVLGERIGQLHAEHGVRFLFGRAPLAIGIEKRAMRVDLGDHVLVADAVVAGIGATPNVELAAGAGLRVDNGIVVDEACRTADPHIYAAGDATAHYSLHLGRWARIESWQVAENQPAVAAANMAGGNAVYDDIPWLWTDQYDWNIQVLGEFGKRQRHLIQGDIKSGVFTVCGVGEDGTLQAIAGVNRGRDISIARRLMKQGVRLRPESQKGTARSFQELVIGSL